MARLTLAYDVHAGTGNHTNVIFYMICQKWIIQGVIAGAVKG